MPKMKMLCSAAALAVTFGLSFASPASAYTVCNRAGDCWHADRRVHFPGVRLSFHSDRWGERHREGRYHWHDADNDHDWHHGYWDHGDWRSR